MPHRRSARRKTATYEIEDLIRDIKALNSSVLLLSQKMNYLVRNEKILGRNFIILNKKLKALEQKKPAITSSVSGEMPFEVKDLLDELDEKVRQNSFMLNEFKTDLSKISSVYAKTEDLKELKYIVEAINPLEFVTLDQVKDLITGQKIKTLKPVKKSKKKK